MASVVSRPAQPGESSRRLDWQCWIVHGCMVYTERAEMAAVSSGTSHEEPNSAAAAYTSHRVDIQSARLKAAFTDMESRVTRAQ